MSDAFKREADKGTIPGAVVMVARRGKIVHFDAVGIQDPATRAPMKRDSIFRIMSMTKPIVSIGLMQLVEDGLLAINDPVSKFIPEFRDQRVGVERNGQLELVPLMREVTVQDLLRHTSGIVYETRGDSPVHRMYRDAGVRSRAVTNTQLAATIGKLPLAVSQEANSTTAFRPTSSAASSRSSAVKRWERICRSAYSDRCG